MTASLRQRIFWWSVGSTLVILLVVFLFVTRGLESTIRSGLEETVESGTRLAAELHRSGVTAGVDRVAALATVPTLRAAVETGDPTTVAENLEGLLDASDAEWLAVTSPEGIVVATAGAGAGERIRAAGAVVEEARFYDTADLSTYEGSLEQISASGIFRGPALMGVLVAGERVGPETIERLELASGQRVAILSDRAILAAARDLDEGARGELSTAWASGIPAATVAPAGDDPGIVREFDLSGSPQFGMAVPIPDASGAPVAQLVSFRSLEEAMAPSRRMRIILFAIAGGGVLVALGSSFVLSRSVTGPIDRLVGETARVGSGDLDHPVQPERADEIGRLAEGFEAMRTSLLRARRELIRAERLSALGRAASAIAHDFRQPVSVIQANVQLLARDLDDPEARDEDFRAIRGELSRLESMMEEILAFARGDDRVSLSPVAVGGLLESVAERARGRSEAEVVVDAEYAGEWPLDPSRTARVLENLVRNATEAVEPGGRVRLGCRASDGALRVWVEDDGPGIPPDIRETVFDPFVTSGKSGGTGLGLAIVRSFTEQQGGSISLDTGPDGTRFLLEFPENGDRREEQGHGGGGNGHGGEREHGHRGERNGHQREQHGHQGERDGHPREERG